jgi:radical SAM protein with 4Fe4S-binding SPASM domain
VLANGRLGPKALSTRPRSMMLRRPRLEHLVIKPTLACTANCPTCAGRKLLHREVRTEPPLSLDDWRRILGDARALGTWELIISGGEPSLYKDLPELVSIGRSFGWQVRLNSNGSLTSPAQAEQLIQAGLGIVDVSLYSPDPGVNDAMRHSKGLWEKATSAIRMLAALRQTYPGFDVISQTILCRENVREFARLLDLHRELGSSGLLVSYLEGDFVGHHLVTSEEIRQFREEVIPQALAVCGALHPSIRLVARRRVGRLFAPAILPPGEWASGTYRPERGACRIPGQLAIVLTNGDVHPCNIVEYTHEPVMGNVRNESLEAIWRGEPRRRYRRQLHDRCEKCPMNMHVYIPLRPAAPSIELARRWLYRLRLDGLERATYPHIKRLQNWSRRRAG